MKRALKCLSDFAHTHLKRPRTPHFIHLPGNLYRATSRNLIGLPPRYKPSGLLGIQPSPLASTSSARLDLLFSKEDHSFFRKAYSISNTRMYLRRVVNSKSFSREKILSSDTARRSCAYLSAVFLLMLSSAATSLTGLSVKLPDFNFEISQSCVRNNDRGQGIL
jgi:hypothetical protein